MSKAINICMIDDDDIYQFTMKLSLKPLDDIGAVNFFNDGLAAIDYIKNHIDNPQKLPDIIFLDINMPVMDGYQFIEEYRQIKSKLDKNIIIYMLSSSIDPVDVKKVKHIDEVSDYLIKPVKQEVLKTIFKDFKEH